MFNVRRRLRKEPRRIPMEKTGRGRKARRKARECIKKQIIVNDVKYC